MLAPEMSPEGCGEACGAVWFAVHGAVDHVGVFKDDGQLAVSIAELGLEKCTLCELSVAF